MPQTRTFTRFIKKLDDRWPKLLGKLEQMKGMPVTIQLEEEWAWELWTGDMTPWKEQFMQLLENFTAGDVTRLVVAGEERGIFTTWGRMADKGHSLRLEHVNDMGHKSFSLKASVLTNDLELGNALSEKVVTQYEEASGDQFPLEN